MPDSIVSSCLDTLDDLVPGLGMQLGLVSRLVQVVIDRTMCVYFLLLYRSLSSSVVRVDWIILIYALIVG